LLTGMPGSGKSIVVEIASREFNIPVYTMGDVVREETIKRYGVITPETMNETSLQLRREHGPQVIAMRIYELIRKDHDIVLIDGVRSLDEVEFFRSKGEVVIVAVHSSPKTRFKRLIERKRPGDPADWGDFVKRDLLELSYGVGSVIALADYMIVNEGNIEDFRNEIRRILAKIVSQT